MKNFDLDNGRSMIEMLGVLAVIGVLSVGGIAGYSKAMMKYRTNKTIEQITQIYANVKIFFGISKEYEGLSGDDIDYPNYTLQKKAKLIPDEMWNGDSTINVFGGELILVQKKGLEKFGIMIRDIPTQACIDIVTQDLTFGNDLTWFEIYGNNDNDLSSAMPSQEVEYYEDEQNCRILAKAIPLSLDIAVQACNCQDL